MTKSTPPYAESLRKPVQFRSQIQDLLLELYALAESSNQEAAGFSHEFHHLIGAAFSLWRAAFLSSPDRDVSSMDADARRFLGVLIRDNAINFPQDREMRAWTAGYYLNNALFRLHLIYQMVPATGSPASEPKEAVASWFASQKASIAPIDLDALWMSAFAAARDLASFLRESKRVQRTAPGA